MIYLKILAALIISISALIVIVYKISVLLSKKYNKSERVSAAIELLLIACISILLLG